MRGKSTWLFLVLIGVFGLLPPVLHTLLSSAPSVSPKDAMATLARVPDRTLLIDVRRDTVYGPSVHAAALPLPQPEQLSPELLRAKDQVFLLCNTGMRGGLMARVFHERGFTNVFAVAGGIEAWIAQSTLSGAGRGETPAAGAGREPTAVARRNQLTWLEQSIICFASFGLKPVYELVTLIIVVVIWRRRESHWRTMRWAMVAFFVGENACAVNFLFYGLENFTWEFWHCYGMLVAFGLAAYALLDFIDHQMIHYSQRDKPCAFLGLCKSCYKHKPVACNLWILFLFAVPAVMLLCFMPLSAPFRNFTCVGKVFGNDVLFTHSLLQQLCEIRIYPWLAMGFLALTWAVLIVGKESAMERSKAFFATGLGVLGFSVLRFLLFWAYAENILWAEAWEEITEFLFVLTVVLLLCLKRINGVIRPVPADCGTPIPARGR